MAAVQSRAWVRERSKERSSEREEEKWEKGSSDRPCTWLYGSEETGGSGKPRWPLSKWRRHMV
jgi:hypothetical protein